MIFEQYYLGCLSQASYLIGDEQTRTAVVVDPRRDIDEYLEDAAKAELAIRHVILTHFHADFVAGHLELRDRVGARRPLLRTGERSSTAASLLEQAGRTNLIDLVGGITAWTAAAREGDLQRV